MLPLTAGHASEMQSIDTCQSMYTMYVSLLVIQVIKGYVGL